MGPSWWQILVVLVLVVVLFGRGKISDLMGDVAKGIKSFKAGLADEDDLQSEPNVVEHDAPRAQARANAPRQILEGAAQTEVRLDARRAVAIQTKRQDGQSAALATAGSVGRRPRGRCCANDHSRAAIASPSCC